MFLKSWDIIHNKGYQSSDTVSSAVTTKVKGLGFIEKDRKSTNSSSANQTEVIVNDNKIEFKTKNSTRLFDVGDYIIPPIEYNSVRLLFAFTKINHINLLK